VVQFVPAYVNLYRILLVCKDSINSAMRSSSAKPHFVVDLRSYRVTLYQIARFVPVLPFFLDI